MSKDTMQDLYGTNVDYTLRINFTSLLKIVDSIGGVNVYSDNNFTVGKYHFVRGYNQLNAKQALAFSRERHSFADGDRQRGKDQQRVIEAIIAKMSNPTNLVRYPNIMKSLEGSFQTNASRSEISAILNQQANSLGKWQTESVSVTGADSHNSTYSMGSMQLYVMEPNKASVDSAKAKISTYKQ
jgi:anionic cell wall polymer biosynthesis LytR-Cps2A-Psr (LCP) family protein